MRKRSMGLRERITRGVNGIRVMKSAMILPPLLVDMLLQKIIAVVILIRSASGMEG
jgi:hypothetical protein